MIGGNITATLQQKNGSTFIAIVRTANDKRLMVNGMALFERSSKNAHGNIGHCCLTR